MTPDLNLLVTLDVLLTEGSVARAAKRLRLSPSAMSRALARLRETTGDPLLVRAGRGLVPTPRALALRDRVSQTVQEATAILRPQGTLDLKRLHKTFTIRCSEGFAETFGPMLMSRVSQVAPLVTLRFVQKTDRESLGLRDGSIDLETGVIAPTTGPEIRVQALFRDRFVGVVRKGHSLAKGRILPMRFACADHVLVSRQGAPRGPIDEALEHLKLKRNVTVLVAGFATAISLVRATDLVASVPERHTAALRGDVFSFALPFKLEEMLVSMMWHPRLDADPAHRWLRDCVQDVCARHLGPKRV